MTNILSNFYGLVVAVLFSIFPIGVCAITINQDGSAAVSSTEWDNIKSVMQTMSETITKTTRDKIFADNERAIAISDADVLRKANTDVMNANIALLQERDALKLSIAAMADCPKSPISSGPTNAMVGWGIPTQRVSGAPISPSELAGYFLYYGTNKDNLNVRLKLPDRNIREYTINGLVPGTYYFAVSAYDTDNVEGFRSNVVTKIIK